MASERDPHGIVPNEFWEEFGSIEAARSAPSSTDETERKRCPECGSVSIRQKASKPADHCTHRKDARYRCAKEGCGAHFDEPELPEAEIEADGGAGS